jgi:hypothetical protein
MKKMKKFGFAAIVASGLTAGILGVAAPILATASAEVLPAAELTGVDHNQWVNTTHQAVKVPLVDTTVHQSR